MRLTLTATALALAACAPAPEKIAPAPVSPGLYAGLSCARLADESRSTASRLGALVAQQEQTASNDAAAVALSALVFWPAMLMVGSGTDHAGEIAQLRGEAAALAEAARVKGCR